MKNRTRALIGISLWLVSVGQADVTHQETANYRTIAATVAEQVNAHGRENVLVVFDIDNTLLSMDTDLGSDAWFEWQAELIKKGQLENAVADSMAGLIEAQATLYYLGKMSETEPAVDEVVKTFQNAGVSVIALTARGPVTRTATVRELRRNGIEFARRGLGQEQKGGSPFLPYTRTSLNEIGISNAEVSQWKLKEPREVSFSEGVFMASGQHKGAMLRILLAQSGAKFSSIVFVDDKEKNTLDVAAGFEATSVDVTAIRYSRKDQEVESFLHGPKNLVAAQWKRLSGILKDLFGATNI